jgi:hypothetical protein
MMKLLIVGLALIGAGLALILFTDFNPGPLFIIGVVCTLAAVVEGAGLRDRGAAGSASDTTDAVDLVNDIRRHH